MKIQSEVGPRPAVHISKKGLTKAGVIVLQTIFIALITFLEVSLRNGVGLFTGLAICVAVFGTIRFGRTGTAYVAATTAPLAFALAAFLTFLKEDGLHPSKLGLDFVASLASAAPYLLISASYSWINFLRSRKSKSKNSAPTSA